MSKLIKPVIPCVITERSYSKENSTLKKTVMELRHENEENKFIINTMKAEIRLFRDTLKKVQKASKKAIYEYDCMD